MRLARAAESGRQDAAWVRALIAALLTAALIAASEVRGADWPQWRGPDENGISTERLPAKPNFDQVLWRKQVGTGFSSVAVAEGRLFTMGHRGPKTGGEETVWCLASNSGAELWTHSYPAPLFDRFYEGGPGATPTVRQGRVFTYSKQRSAGDLAARLLAARPGAVVDCPLRLIGLGVSGFHEEQARQLNLGLEASDRRRGSPVASK